jgi:hypothetical protein
MSSLAFLRKHRRVLPVVGAGVVLATFFIREVKSDDLRDMLSDIQRARDVAFIKKQFDNLSEHIGQKLPESLGRDKFSDARIEVDEERKYLTDIASDIMTDEELTIAARLDSDAISRVTEMKKLVDETAASLARAGPSVFATRGRSKEDREAEGDRAIARLEEASLAVGRLKQESEDYSKFVESAVERKKAAAERFFKFYSKLSYWFLFPLGWTLGLVGKLLGQDTDVD